MYLARRFVDNHISYSLCESYRRGGELRSRVLLDLGEDPRRYIIYPGGTSFYIDEIIEERLSGLNVRVDQDILEELFFPFVDPYIRTRIAPFMARQDTRRRRPVSSRERERIGRETHPFDRRRLHFLRCGRTDPGRLQGFVSPLFRVLLDKSRDEIEQYFLAQEAIVKPREYHRYLFTIFDLRQHFSRASGGISPLAQPRHEIDEAFLTELCRLNADAEFWSGMERRDRLPGYLVRYLVMYFDYSFPPPGRGPFLGDFSRRGRRPASSGRPVSPDEAGTIFGVSAGRLAAMNRRELTRLYRRRAHELHPDKGGDNEQFIRLTAAYHALLRGRS